MYRFYYARINKTKPNITPQPETNHSTPVPTKETLNIPDYKEQLLATNNESNVDLFATYNDNIIKNNNSEQISNEQQSTFSGEIF